MQPNKIINNILGMKPRMDIRSRNMLDSDKNRYGICLKEMSDKSKILKDGRLFIEMKNLEDKYPEETAEIRDSLKIKRNVPF